MAARKGVPLSSGHLMPTIGLGVYKAASGWETYRAVLSALQLGYRLIDTAQVGRVCDRQHMLEQTRPERPGGPFS